MSTCRSCGASLLWVESENSKPMPLNAQPDPERGNVEIVHSEARRGPVGIVHPGPIPGGYLSHHASCPQGKAWKRA